MGFMTYFFFFIFIGLQVALLVWTLKRYNKIKNFDYKVYNSEFLKYYFRGVSSQESEWIKTILYGLIRNKNISLYNTLSKKNKSDFELDVNTVHSEILRKLEYRISSSTFFGAILILTLIGLFILINVGKLKRLKSQLITNFDFFTKKMDSLDSLSLNTTDDLVQKLNDLAKLLEKDIITKEEYDKKRKQIIDNH